MLRIDHRHLSPAMEEMANKIKASIDASLNHARKVAEEEHLRHQKIEEENEKILLKERRKRNEDALRFLKRLHGLM